MNLNRKKIIEKLKVWFSETDITLGKTCVSIFGCKYYLRIDKKELQKADICDIEDTLKPYGFKIALWEFSHNVLIVYFKR